MQLGQHAVLPLPLDPDEDFAAVEPPAEGPEDGEDEEALHERSGGAFEEGVAEPGAADAADPAGGELVGDVDGDGVHADDDEREGPGFVAFDVDDPVEESEGPEDDGAAVKGPGGRPEAFDDGAEGGTSHEREDEAERPGFEQPVQFLAGGLAGTEVLARHEPEDHGDERGDEVQGLVAAAVEDERLLAREQVQEPLVKGRREIGVHVPVRPKAIQGLACLGHAEGLELGPRSGDGREHERGPSGDGDDTDGPELYLPAPAHEQREEDIAESDLSEDVREDEVGPRPGAGGQEHAEGDEQERPPTGMQPKLPLVLTLCGASRR